MDHRFRHLSDASRALLEPMLPHLFPSGSGARGGRPPVSDLVCLDAVIDVAEGTRRRDVRRISHGVSRNTAPKRLRFRATSAALAEIMDPLVPRGVHGRNGVSPEGGAIDLGRVSVDSRGIRATKGAHTPVALPPIAANWG